MPEEPTPFEKMRALARAVVSVPKAEIDRREEEWRKGRQKEQKPRPPKKPA